MIIHSNKINTDLDQEYLNINNYPTKNEEKPKIIWWKRETKKSNPIVVAEYSDSFEEYQAKNQSI